MATGYMEQLLSDLESRGVPGDLIPVIREELVRSFKNGLMKGRDGRKDRAEKDSLSLTEKPRRLR